MGIRETVRRVLAARSAWRARRASIGSRLGRLGLVGALVAVVAGAVTVGTVTGAGLAAAQGNTIDMPSSYTWQFTPANESDAKAGFFWSSPNLAQLPSGPAVVAGDRNGFLYAVPLSSTGAATTEWQASDTGDAPIDSAPSVTPVGGSPYDSVFVGAGNASDPVNPANGYYGFSPTGQSMWMSSTDDAGADNGVQASLTVGQLGGAGNTTVTGVVAGSFGQQAYALNAQNGSTLPGWPFFDSDSTFSTPAVADLYGTGQSQVVEGADQTTGFAAGQNYTAGGHLRILNNRGGLICNYDTNQTVYSSPAVGGFLAGEATGEVVGTGNFYTSPPPSNTDQVLAFDNDCHLKWAATLNGYTTASPALADVLGNGQLQVVEGTNDGSISGGSSTVYALDGATGNVDWKTTLPGQVIGSVATADLTGLGYQDVIVATTSNQYILDGKTGDQVGEFPTYTYGLNVESTPLITNDPNGTIGVTFDGWHYVPNDPDFDTQGTILHFELPNPGDVSVAETGAWPQFHHDPQLTGDAGGTTAKGSIPPCQIPSAAFSGYNLVAADGGIFSFGMPFCGSTGGMRLNKPIVGMAMAPNTGGYWLVASDGGIFAYGGARFYGSMGGQRLVAPIVGMAATPDGGGYWLVASDGGIFAFGDAPYWGSTGGTPLSAPIDGMAATGDGHGYRFVSQNGTVYPFGNAQTWQLEPGNSAGNGNPAVGMATSIPSGGYWVVTAQGYVDSAYATYLGSPAGAVARPIVAIQPTSSGYGYWLVGSDGGIFNYGNAPYLGSMGGHPLNQPVVGMAGS
jgi:hypothetical protein